jgi:hypothetical protein
MTSANTATREFLLLLAHDRRRITAVVKRPRPGVWLSILLPLLLVGGALGAAGADALPDSREVGGAVGLGFLASAPLAFLSYGVLFRPADDPFLRRLGLAPTSLYLERALRLLGIALGVALLLLVPFLSAAAPVGRPLSVLLGTALAAWGAALLALSAAARLTADPDRRPGFASRMMGFDRELVRAGPVVYAPLAPLAAGLMSAAWIGASTGIGSARAAAIGLAGLFLAAAAAAPFAQALPRFAPQALEMAFSPPPEAGEAGLVLERGVGRLLPLRARAVLARDAVITARRFRWSTTLVWPVAILSAIALARWGELPQVRTWVLAAGMLTLAAQGAAVISLGRLERSGPGWLDHATGLSLFDRWLGRSAFGFGLTLWLAVPLGLAWGLWAGIGSGWMWVSAGAATAVVAAGASLAAAGR